MDDATLRLLVNRMVRAAKLQRGLYAEVAADITATRQAVAVVVITALAAFISDQIGPPDLSWLGIPAEADGGSSFGILLLIIGPILAIVAWLAWSVVAWYVGTRMIAQDSQDVQFLEVARAIGFAQTPSVLGVTLFIPVLGLIIQVGVLFWVLATGFIAIRESMRLTDGQAAGTMVVSVIAFFVMTAMTTAIVGLAIP
ncbi:MAG: YIP1 family protein [Chloroflexi bacterium]|nr:YIP1 family protein [Chloroflexota bacterium]